jgi:hypothetical protein
MNEFTNTPDFQAAVKKFEQPLPDEHDLFKQKHLERLQPRKQSAARRAGKWAVSAGAAVVLLPAAFNQFDKSPTVQHEINMENQAQQAQPTQAEINRAVSQEEQRAAREHEAVEMQDNTGTHVR